MSRTPDSYRAAYTRRQKKKKKNTPGNAQREAEIAIARAKPPAPKPERPGRLIAPIAPNLPKTRVTPGPTEAPAWQGQLGAARGTTVPQKPVQLPVPQEVKAMNYIRGYYNATGAWPGPVKFDEFLHSQLSDELTRNDISELYMNSLAEANMEPLQRRLRNDVEEDLYLDDRYKPTDPTFNKIAYGEYSPFYLLGKHPQVARELEIDKQANVTLPEARTRSYMYNAAMRDPAAWNMEWKKKGLIPGDADINDPNVARKGIDTFTYKANIADAVILNDQKSWTECKMAGFGDGQLTARVHLTSIAQGRDAQKQYLFDCTYATKPDGMSDAAFMLAYEKKYGADWLSEAVGKQLEQVTQAGPFESNMRMMKYALGFDNPEAKEFSEWYGEKLPALKDIDEGVFAATNWVGRSNFTKKAMELGYLPVDVATNRIPVTALYLVQGVKGDEDQGYWDAKRGIVANVLENWDESAGKKVVYEGARAAGIDPLEYPTLFALTQFATETASALMLDKVMRYGARKAGCSPPVQSFAEKMGWEETAALVAKETNAAKIQAFLPIDANAAVWTRLADEMKKPEQVKRWWKDEGHALSRDGHFRIDMRSARINKKYQYVNDPTISAPQRLLFLPDEHGPWDLRTDANIRAYEAVLASGLGVDKAWYWNDRILRNMSGAKAGVYRKLLDENHIMVLEKEIGDHLENLPVQDPKILKALKKAGVENPTAVDAYHYIDSKLHGWEFKGRQQSEYLRRRPYDGNPEIADLNDRMATAAEEMSTTFTKKEKEDAEARHANAQRNHEATQENTRRSKADHDAADGAEWAANRERDKRQVANDEQHYAATKTTSEEQVAVWMSDILDELERELEAADEAARVAGREQTAGRSQVFRAGTVDVAGEGAPGATNLGREANANLTADALRRAQEAQPEERPTTEAGLNAIRDIRDRRTASVFEEQARAVADDLNPRSGGGLAFGETIEQSARDEARARLEVMRADLETVKQGIGGPNDRPVVHEMPDHMMSVEDAIRMERALDTEHKGITIEDVDFREPPTNRKEFAEWKAEVEKKAAQTGDSNLITDNNTILVDPWGQRWRIRNEGPWGRQEVYIDPIDEKGRIQVGDRPSEHRTDRYIGYIDDNAAFHLDVREIEYARDYGVGHSFAAMRRERLHEHGVPASEVWKAQNERWAPYLDAREAADNAHKETAKAKRIWDTNVNLEDSAKEALEDAEAKNASMDPSVEGKAVPGLPGQIVKQRYFKWDPAVLVLARKACHEGNIVDSEMLRGAMGEGAVGAAALTAKFTSRAFRYAVLWNISTVLRILSDEGTRLLMAGVRPTIPIGRGIRLGFQTPWAISHSFFTKEVQEQLRQHPAVQNLVRHTLEKVNREPFIRVSPNDPNFMRYFHNQILPMFNANPAKMVDDTRPFVDWYEAYKAEYDRYLKSDPMKNETLARRSALNAAKAHMKELAENDPFYNDPENGFLASNGIGHIRTPEETAAGIPETVDNWVDAIHNQGQFWTSKRELEEMFATGEDPKHYLADGALRDYIGDIYAFDTAMRWRMGGSFKTAKRVVQNIVNMPYNLLDMAGKEMKTQALGKFYASQKKRLLKLNDERVKRGQTPLTEEEIRDQAFEAAARQMEDDTYIAKHSLAESRAGLFFLFAPAYINAAKWWIRWMAKHPMTTATVAQNVSNMPEEAAFPDWVPFIGGVNPKDLTRATIMPEDPLDAIMPMQPIFTVTADIAESMHLPGSSSIYNAFNYGRGFESGRPLNTKLDALFFGATEFLAGVTGKTPVWNPGASTQKGDFFNPKATETNARNRARYAQAIVMKQFMQEYKVDPRAAMKELGSSEAKRALKGWLIPLRYGMNLPIFTITVSGVQEKGRGGVPGTRTMTIDLNRMADAQLAYLDAETWEKPQVLKDYPEYEPIAQAWELTGEKQLRFLSKNKWVIPWVTLRRDKDFDNPPITTTEYARDTTLYGPEEFGAAVMGQYKQVLAYELSQRYKAAVEDKVNAIVAKRTKQVPGYKTWVEEWWKEPELVKLAKEFAQDPQNHDAIVFCFGADALKTSTTAKVEKRVNTPPAWVEKMYVSTPGFSNSKFFSMRALENSGDKKLLDVLKASPTYPEYVAKKKEVEQAESKRRAAALATHYKDMLTPQDFKDLGVNIPEGYRETTFKLLGTIAQYSKKLDKMYHEGKFASDEYKELYLERYKAVEQGRKNKTVRAILDRSPIQWLSYGPHALNVPHFQDIPWQGLTGPAGTANQSSLRVYREWVRYRDEFFKKGMTPERLMEVKKEIHPVIAKNFDEAVRAWEWAYVIYKAGQGRKVLENYNNPDGWIPGYTVTSKFGKQMVSWLKKELRPLTASKHPFSKTFIDEWELLNGYAGGNIEADLLNIIY